MRTSISIGLRVIPPSAGLSRKAKHALPKLTRRTPQQYKQYLSVVIDEELEAEIKAYEEKIK